MIRRFLVIGLLWINNGYAADTLITDYQKIRTIYTGQFYTLQTVVGAIVVVILHVTKKQVITDYVFSDDLEEQISALYEANWVYQLEGSPQMDGQASSFCTYSVNFNAQTTSTAVHIYCP